MKKKDCSCQLQMAFMKPKSMPTSTRKGPATQAWMVQWRLFRDMVATF